MVRRRLDVELVRRRLVPSRARAVEAIESGRVTVAGAPATTAARQVGPDEALHVEPEPAPYVSRGGQKLAGALDAFGVSVHGRRCLDAGASTGGFTDCLLARGASSVVAVDVGHGQLDWRLRNDPRVDVRERTNVRTLTSADIDPPADLVTADLAFISLRTVAHALASVATDDADFVLLVKPQFEAGRDRVGKGGVVRDPAVHEAVLHDVIVGLAACGLGVQALVPSPITGAGGNIEYFAHARRAEPRATDDDVRSAVRAAHASLGRG